ncbi:hypothetical protein A9267_17215 [Shewanella sp. UCD-FRSSP16_17]|uniref:hypothetical protein n=1 Tax=Shewanella sp. UCD-FRSSP16_17 TaxID=1853256 RepID=UPI0007EEC8B1|nr:hypothetical protein [Shewanella sp. UCD-FRSSP16_17]OBT04689.1 hypothetical protein A9267_17215 [Shewanella sp. UCD-FRSSP16_17]
MNETVPISILSEADILKQAASLVDRGEIKLATKLLEQAYIEKPYSEKLISILSSLHYKLGNHAKAKEYTEAAFNNLASSVIHSELDLPNENDFAFLADKSCELEDAEYSFESPSTLQRKSTRKILSLNRKVPPSPDEVEAKIYHRSKKKHVPLKPHDLQDEVDLSDTSSSPLKQVEITIPESCKPILSTNSLTNNTELENEKLQKPVEVLDDVEVLNDVEVELDGFYDEIYEEHSDDGIENATFIYSKDVPEDELFSTDNNELEIYDLWVDDEPTNDVDNNEDNIVLENILTFEDRARFVAVDCIIELGWHSSELPFLVSVFSGPGWHNTKATLIKEVQSGATVEELELAFEVKTLWKDSSRYWITFSKAWVSGESADSTYKHCSWKQALRLVRLFDGLPVFEEIYDFLETEFEYWYGHTILRRCFPAFNHYLFSYRLQRRNMDSMLQGFTLPEFSDGLDAPWSYLPHSDEMSSLKDMGIDLTSKFVCKNSFLSDDYTEDCLSELWIQKA